MKSQASRLSKNSQIQRKLAADQKSQMSKQSKADDARSVAPSVVSSTMSVEEEDEWTAI